MSETTVECPRGCGEPMALHEPGKFDDDGNLVPSVCPLPPDQDRPTDAQLRAAQAVANAHRPSSPPG
jgi:hypothetical protein